MVCSHKKMRPTVASTKRRSGERAGTFESLTSRRLNRQRMKEMRKKKGVQTMGAPADHEKLHTSARPVSLVVDSCC